MDVRDLEYRARTWSGCIPPELVSRLLERGHADVVESQAAGGDWFCALAWARVLHARGREADAVGVLAPYVATGWWTAVAAAAELLEDWGHVDEAIEMIRHRMKAGHPMALGTYTRLLARYGRAEEAFELLVPYVDDGALAAALVDVAGPAGRDEEAAELLVGRIRFDHCCDDPWCCRGLDPDTAIGLLATIRERQGRIEEAIALLRRRQLTSVSGRDQLADLLSRHGRIGELRDYAATEGHREALRRLAVLLEEGGDVTGAIDVYRQAGDSANVKWELAQLLARHGRPDEAIAVMRSLSDTHHNDDAILHAWSELCLDQGRPADGLAHLDALDARRGGVPAWELYWMRLPLIAACGGVDEAVARARAHPEGGTWYAAEHLADLLARAGRAEEAVAVLRQHDHGNSHDLAGHLVDLGRVEEALALLLPAAATPTPPLVPTARLWSDEPPF
ncbi:tetratricopeptide repeat protein [Streptomyces manipurensis]|uniref:tetratricopeptide repeat protein n=1 Tax=Streptomyces manipurensis TaxID=1077945 RepID=UPI003C6F856D